MIKGIIFDLDGVYFKNGKKNFIKNLNKKFNINEKLIEDIFLKCDLMRKYKRGEISGKEFWNYAIKEWKIKSSPKEILTILQSGYEINENAVKIIERLKIENIKSIICSNNFKERIKVLDERFDFLKDFDFVILSYEQGLLKPELLKKVLVISRFKPEEIIVIDDSEEIIKEAENMNFKTILCNNPEEIEVNIKKLNIFL